MLPVRSLETITKPMQSRNFSIRACEDRAAKTFEFAHNNYSPFQIGDPFGLRKAILPVFERSPDGTLIGMGTAFHADGWGGCLTAEHVLEFSRKTLPKSGLTGAEWTTLDPSKHPHPVLLLGYGVIFGTPRLPDWLFAPVLESQSVVQTQDNPLAQLQGKPDFEIAIDAASLRIAIPEKAETHERIKSMPIQLSGWTPQIGEPVMAFGYPELKPNQRITNAQRSILIEDGLFGVFGEISEVFQQGRSIRDQAPSFSVKTNWPSGLSGGPVINKNGNVIGIVSRSLPQDGDLIGVGHALCLPDMAKDICRLLPTIDPKNPGWRNGYALIDQATNNCCCIFMHETEAAETAKINLSKYKVVSVSNKIGSDDWIPQP